MENCVQLKTRTEFKKFVNENKFVIVKASAKWCGPCKRCAPLFHDLFQKLPKNVYFVELDIDQGPDLARFLKVKSVPTMINYIEGMPYDIVTSSSKENVVDFFNKTWARIVEAS
jgi:thioredoxin-like negative regulator of GroEL